MFGPMVAMVAERVVFFHSPTEEEFTMNVFKVMVPLIWELRGVPLRLIMIETGKEASVSQRTVCYSNSYKASLSVTKSMVSSSSKMKNLSMSWLGV